MLPTSAFFGAAAESLHQAFLQPLLEHARSHDHHACTVEGDIDVERICADFKTLVLRSHRLETFHGATFMDRLYLRLTESAYAAVDPEFIHVLAPTMAEASGWADRIGKYRKPAKASRRGFYMIAADISGISAEFVPAPTPVQFDDATLALHYGDDFPAWHRSWVAALRGRPSGVSVLHGPPGTGKTTYLRSLLTALGDHAVVYFLPTSEFDLLSNPSLMRFWIREGLRHAGKTKIAILEDAEELLVARREGRHERLSNLLSAADGFLGDQLRLQIVATTNAPLRSLDPAILRHGRLIGSRAFERLDRVRALRLAETRGIGLPHQADYSLAEVFCAQPLGQPTLEAPRSIGFR